MAIETFDQSDEETWPDQKIPTFYTPTYLSTYLLTHLPQLENTNSAQVIEIIQIIQLLQLTQLMTIFVA